MVINIGVQNTSNSATQCIHKTYIYPQHLALTWVVYGAAVVKVLKVIQTEWARVFVDWSNQHRTFT